LPAIHKGTVYKPVDLGNPFSTDSDKAYSDLLQDYVGQIKWWRMIGVASLVLFAISLMLFNASVRQQKTVPVLVNVMPSGEAQYLGEVRQGQVQVPEAAVVFQVRTFITKLRSVSSDYQVVYVNIDDCYAMITSNYEPAMTRTLRASSPFDLVGKIRRSLEIESIIKITAETYQVDWIETSLEGSSRRNARMRALVSVKLLAASDATIVRNPLGIYIDNCEWTEL
jgi:type IV secretion system protein VirB5